MGSAFSVVASVAILRSTVNDIVPEELRTYFWSFTRRFSTEITISIKESHEGSSNRLFYAVVAYLDGHALSNSALPQRLTVGKSEKIRNLMFGLERNSEIVDKFQDVPMKWKYNTDFNSTSQLETRWYELRFHKMHAEMVTLAGLLNAIDGLLSCCGEEKITVFTTNYKERIDPALLRPGRMDVHINLSYCTLSTFKQLAANYLEIFNDELFPIIEKLIAKVKVSPADVAGVLMTTKNSKTSLEDLVKFLENKESEDRSSVAAEQENHNNSNQKIQRQGEAFITNEIGESTNDLMKNEALISKYTIKEELVAILKAMFSKHGDIAANTTLHSMQCISSFLEILCGIIQKLHATKLQDLTEVEVKAMISEVEDLESVKIEVGWLRKRLDEISNAMRLIELKAVSEKLSDTIFGAQVKLTCCETKSLVDGLL
ncbi:hypothetical protein Pint_27529 [Pistacia integerrima]|uniref:Uncharacterized protein n=1 Tax=Pistacia integerrima TaxID=434235 RepID=A0ACC0YSV3_9ROSI|nr:hypothetical protein Pint_27529 [Pistacia integerrima]